MENYWFADPSKKFMLGDDLTLADISCANELMQLTVSNQASLLDQVPKVKAWLERMKQEVPEFKAISEEGLEIMK